jgi:hypothetical protein
MVSASIEASSKHGGQRLARTGDGQLRAYARALTGRALHDEASFQRRPAILQTAQCCGVVAPRATGTVVAHLNPQLSILNPGRDFGASCASVLDGVGERLADNEIRRRFHASR